MCLISLPTNPTPITPMLCTRLCAAVVLCSTDGSMLGSISCCRTFNSSSQAPVGPAASQHFLVRPAGPAAPLARLYQHNLGSTAVLLSCNHILSPVFRNLLVAIRSGAGTVSTTTGLAPMCFPVSLQGRNRSQPGQCSLTLPCQTKCFNRSQALVLNRPSHIETAGGSTQPELHLLTIQ